MNLRIIIIIIIIILGRYSSGGIATRYGLESPGIEYGRGRFFRTRPERSWGPHSLRYNRYRVFPGRKRPELCVDHPPPSSAEVEERVEMYFYARLGPRGLLQGEITYY